MKKKQGEKKSENYIKIFQFYYNNTNLIDGYGTQYSRNTDDFLHYFGEDIRRDKVRIFIIFSENNFKGIFVGKYWEYYRIWRNIEEFCCYHSHTFKPNTI